MQVLGSVFAGSWLLRLACGSYDPAHGAFDLERPPTCDAGPKEREVHADALARERENYSVDLDAASDPG